MIKRKRKKRYSESIVIASQVLAENFESFRNDMKFPVDLSKDLQVDDKRILCAYLVFCLENRSVEDETPLADSPEDIVKEETYEDKDLDSALAYLMGKCKLYSGTKWIALQLEKSLGSSAPTTEN